MWGAERLIIGQVVWLIGVRTLGYPLFKHFRSYLLNTPMGMFLGVLVFCSLGYVFDAEFSAGVEKFYTFLITVLVSLLVASFALAGVFANIASQREKDEDTRKRKLLAARAKLPMALSKADRTFDAGFRNSFVLEKTDEDEALLALQIDSTAEMTLPDDVVATFLEVIEHHDDPIVANRLSGLLREYQVFIARWVSEFEPRGDVPMLTTPENARQRAVSWAYLVCIVGSLFDYARGQEGQGQEVLGEVNEEVLGSVLGRLLPIGHSVNQYSDEIGLYARTFARRFT